MGITKEMLEDFLAVSKYLTEAGLDKLEAKIASHQ